MEIRKAVGLTVVALALCAAVVLVVYWTMHSTMPRNANPRAVLTTATYTRALASEAPVMVQRQLQSMPVAIFQRDAASDRNALLAWSLFFKGSMIRLGRLRTATPQIAYYNPIVDVAVIENCRYSKVDGKPMCLRMCAKPGEALTGEAPTRSPGWLTAQDPLQAMLKATARRMSAFDRASDGLLSPKGVECTVKDQAVSELRVVDVSGAVAKVDVRQFSKAVAAYLTRVAASARSLDFSSRTAVATDPTLTVLIHLDQLSLSGAVSAGQDTRILFFTPKRSGWGQVAMVFSVAPKGTWALKNVRLLAMSSKAE
jgi:hypothetical protein